MAGAPVPPTAITNDTFTVAPIGDTDDTLRVMYIHGGGSREGLDRTEDSFAQYLRARFTHFSMRSVRHTSDFELVVQTHAEELKSFAPDVVVGRSQGGPTILELIHRGYWQGPSLLCCPAIVPLVDDHLTKLPTSAPILILAGTVDQQVPLARVVQLWGDNRERLGQGLGLVVVEDLHSLKSVCNDTTPANGVDVTTHTPDGTQWTLYDLVRRVWTMREAVRPKGDTSMKRGSQSPLNPSRPQSQKAKILKCPNVGAI